jgi:hypothetical protein
VTLGALPLHADVDELSAANGAGRKLRRGLREAGIFRGLGRWIVHEWLVNSFFQSLGLDLEE